MSTPSVLLIIPPLTQLNTPYPSTAYLTGFLHARGYLVHQADVGIEMVLALFSQSGMARVFEALRSKGDSDLPGEARQMLSLSRTYVETIDPVIRFLQGRDPTLATRICQGDFLPQGPRFADSDSIQSLHGRSQNQSDQAKHLATLYLEDLADLIQATIAPHFEGRLKGEIKGGGNLLCVHMEFMRPNAVLFGSTPLLGGSSQNWFSKRQRDAYNKERIFSDQNDGLSSLRHALTVRF